ncbi:MAG: GntR family transcriptional regulator [Lachnospiraceae bacterium]|nr:GntR family transcriptional regulator [Lachnospiraceae bacterium]
MSTNLVLFPRLEQENHKEYAYRLLRDNIMALNLPPGTPINEGELSELLNISRTPVHEAVMKLKDELLIDVFPQRGSQVSKIDIKTFQEGYFLRYTVETSIIMEIAGHVSQDGMEQMQENLELQRQSAEDGGSVDEFLKLDNAFHQILYYIAEKPHIWYAVRGVNSHYDRVRYVDAIINSSDLKSFYQEHKKIYYYLLMGVPPEAELKQFYAAHLGSFQKNFQYILETYPEYFKQVL